MPRPPWPLNEGEEYGALEPEVEDTQPEAEQQPCGAEAASCWARQRDAEEADGDPEQEAEVPFVDFTSWLELRLADERSRFASEVKKVLDKHLVQHHRHLLKEVDEGAACSSYPMCGNHSNSFTHQESNGGGQNGGGVFERVTQRPSRGVSSWSCQDFQSECGATMSRLSTHLPPLISPKSSIGLNEFRSVSSAGNNRSNVAFTPQSVVSSRRVSWREDAQAGSGSGSAMALATQNLHLDGHAVGQMSSMNTQCVAGANSNERRRYKSDYIAHLSNASKHAGSVHDMAFFHRLVTSHYFEFATCILITLNMLVICLEVQYIGCGLGRTLNHPDVSDSCGSLSAPGMETGFTVMAVLFSCCFTMEFLMRLGHLGFQACFSGWMWFDLLVLTFGTIDTINRLGTPMFGLGVNPTAMRTARIARMMRMVKIFRGRETFHTLFLLMKSIMASKHALGWSLSILGFTMTCVGLLMNQFLHTYLSDASISAVERREVFDYFGTYTRMLITMFEITLGNWAPPSRILMVNISQWWGLFIVVYRCMFCFSLVHVTAAVFITETSRVASDDEVQMMRKQRTDGKTSAVLAELFKEIDTSGDGLMSLQELRAAMQDNLMKDLMEILELDIADIEELYGYMDCGNGGVPQEDFISAILRLRGNAKTSKLVAMTQLIKSLEKKVDAVSDSVVTLAKAMARPSRSGMLAASLRH